MIDNRITDKMNQRRSLYVGRGWEGDGTVRNCLTAFLNFDVWSVQSKSKPKSRSGKSPSPQEIMAEKRTQRKGRK